MNKDLYEALKNAAFDGWDGKQTDAFFEWADAEMLKAADTKSFKNLRVREKIQAGVKAWFLAVAPYKSAAMLILRRVPPHKALKYLWISADRLWWAAGDNATDFNHYSKRTLLSGVMASTMVYWLNDNSAHHEKTWDFLQNRIEDIMKIGGVIGKIKTRMRGHAS
jgi:ubiquinone biosynthesis protein COQ9